MAKVTVTVCDECGIQEGVKHYDLREDARRAAVDLCGTHGVRLEQLLDKKPAGAQKRTAARPRTTRKVTSMDEIEALKKKKA